MLECLHIINIAGRIRRYTHAPLPSHHVGQCVREVIRETLLRVGLLDVDEWMREGRGWAPMYLLSFVTTIVTRPRTTYHGIATGNLLSQ